MSLQVLASEHPDNGQRKLSTLRKPCRLGPLLATSFPEVCRYLCGVPRRRGAHCTRTFADIMGGWGGGGGAPDRRSTTRTAGVLQVEAPAEPGTQAAAGCAERRTAPRAQGLGRPRLARHPAPARPHPVPAAVAPAGDGKARVRCMARRGEEQSLMAKKMTFSSEIVFTGAS